MNADKMTLDAEAITAEDAFTTFPVGYYQLHPDVSINFQMNRFYNWTNDESVLAEMRTIAPRIRDYTDYKREFFTLAEKALIHDQKLKAAYYLRAAEFFIFPDEPEKLPTRERFLRLIREHYGIKESELLSIPYGNSILPAYRFTPEQSRNSIVLFGGFDSYIEEFFPIAFSLVKAGYDVVLFEGPGQGGALEYSGLPMMHEWERPVEAVLDHFCLKDVTLLGISLGGGLAIRAAAFEPRVRRVIAYDILFDFRECLFRQVTPALKAILKLLLAVRARGLVNTLVWRAAMRKPVVAWGIRQGMHVLGVATPYEFFQTAKLYTTKHISKRVTADVLLLAGREDHYVPLCQFHRQAGAVGNARSLTGRVFTHAEQAQDHCQIGNVGLALEVIVNWLDRLIGDRGPR